MTCFVVSNSTVKTSVGSSRNSSETCLETNFQAAVCIHKLQCIRKSSRYC